MGKAIVNLAVAGFFFLGSIWLWCIADGFPTSPRYSQVDTDFWPKLVFGLMALTTGGQVISSILGLRAQLKAWNAGLATNTGMPSAQSVFISLRVIAMAILIMAYYFGFQYLGFSIATLLFLWLASFTVSFKMAAVKILFAPLFTLILVFIFTRVLALPLPRGVGVFYDISLLLY